MFTNYLKTALRNFVKRVNFSIINIAGLATGICAVILISLYVESELSYDSFHKDSELIYRIAWFEEVPQTRTPHPMSEEMVSEFPEVQAAVSLSPLWGPGLTKQTFAVKNPATVEWFDEKEILSVDSTFFDVFDFALVKGNKEEVLKNVGGILVSESMAEKYYRNENPLGKFLAINNDEQLLMIEGVFEDIPENSHFHFDFLVSYVTTKAYSDPESNYYTWGDFGHFNYIKVVPGTNIEVLESKTMEWVARKVDWTESQLEGLKSAGLGFRMQPIEDIHLKSNIRWELESNGNISYVYIMSAAALLILTIATLNFINLSTARSIDRAKEVGIRKAIGAGKGQLIRQFIGESFLLTFIAFILAIMLSELFLPAFNGFTGKSLEVFSISNLDNLVKLIVLFLIVSFFAGFYPSIYLSRLQPGEVLKGKFKTSKSGLNTRKLLVVGQYVITTFLIAGSITIYNQLMFIKNKDLGFNQDNVLVIPVKSDEVRSRFEALKGDIQNLSSVQNVSAASNLPGTQFNQNPFYLETDPEVVIGVSEFRVDYDIFNTLGLSLLKGRIFDKNNPVDRGGTYIINESAAKALSISEPGNVAVLDAEGDLLKGEIVGIVKDFHFKSLHQPIRPIIFQQFTNYNYALVKLDSKNYQSSLASIEEVWKKYDPQFEFEYFFLNNSIQQQYERETRMASMFTIFGVLAIIIASVGLLGLASISFVQKQKEVSIRKVMGASGFTLASELVKDFSILIGVSLIISVPFTWLVMSNWLTNFTYRITVQPITFIIAGLIIFVITYITLSGLLYNTIRKNPAYTLQGD